MMPVASWIAVAFAAAIPLVVQAERRAGRRGVKPALAMTLAAIATGVAGIAAGASDDADAHVGRGVTLRKLGFDDLALDAYRRAIALAPGRSDIWYNVGNLHLGQGLRFRYVRGDYSGEGKQVLLKGIYRVFP